jgi:hypothetical protein
MLEALAAPTVVIQRDLSRNNVARVAFKTMEMEAVAHQHLVLVQMESRQCREMMQPRHLQEMECTGSTQRQEILYRLVTAQVVVQIKVQQTFQEAIPRELQRLLPQLQVLHRQGPAVVEDTVAAVPLLHVQTEMERQVQRDSSLFQHQLGQLSTHSYRCLVQVSEQLQLIPHFQQLAPLARLHGASVPHCQTEFLSMHQLVCFRDRPPRQRYIRTMC